MNSKKYQGQLLELRSRLTGEVASMVETMQDDSKANGALSSLPMHPADQANGQLDAEVDVLHNERDMLISVDEALERVADGSFGKCQRCETSISEERLDAIPYTPHCLKCAEKVQREFAEG